jgi:hypothetical protein
MRRPAGTHAPAQFRCAVVGGQQIFAHRVAGRRRSVIQDQLVDQLE